MGAPGSLSETDQFLIHNAEIGFQRAEELLSWWKVQAARGALKQVPVDPGGTPKVHLEIFYDRWSPTKPEWWTAATPPAGLNPNYQTATLHEKQATVQGVSWSSHYRRKAISQPAWGPSLKSFIEKQFLRRCLWTHSDGLPGGFTFKALQYKLQGKAEYGRFPGEGPPADLAEIGEKYEWIIMEAVVNDFFRVPLGNHPWLLRRMPIMTSYVLAHRNYFSSFVGPLAGTADECCFGYSFLPCPANKTIFGYGPGSFVGAVKQFRFILLENGDIEIQMFFLVSPRSEKILDLHGFDPVYSFVNIVNALTLNLLGFKQWAHDKLDAVQLGLHAKIYQSLLDGNRQVWEGQNCIEQRHHFEDPASQRSRSTER